MTAIYTTIHNGKVAGRKSADHVEQKYFFAVWTLSRPYWEPNETPTWDCVAYCSRRDLAEAQARAWAKSKATSEVAIEPVTAAIKLTKRQQIWAATADLPAGERLSAYHARLAAKI